MPQPYDYQSIFRTMSGIKGLKDDKQRREINALKLKSLKREESESFNTRIDAKRKRLFETEDRKHRNFAKFYNLAKDAPTPEAAKKIMTIGGFPDANIGWEGKNTFFYQDGDKIEGPKSVIDEFMAKLEDDPTWWTDPEKKKQTGRWLFQNGATLTPAKETKTAETPEEKRLRALKTYRGKKKIDKETKVPKPAFTPMNLLKIEQSILDTDLTQKGAIEKTQSLIDSFNANTDKPYAYEIDPGEVTAYFDGKSDRPPSIKKVPKTAAGAKKDYGASEHPEGTKAKNPQGVRIITRSGRWVEE